MLGNDQEIVRFDLEKVDIIEKSFVSLSERVDKKKRELDNIKKDISERSIEKKKLEEEIVSMQIFLKELSEAVATNEKVLAYNTDKEQFLNRKEADLIKYEQRVEKQREEINNDNKMKFE